MPRRPKSPAPALAPAKTIPELLAERDRHHAAALAAESSAIRLALDQGGWYVARAAELLGWRQQTLNSVLEPGRRHAKIGDELRAHRKSTGYHGGNPNLIKREPE